MWLYPSIFDTAHSQQKEKYFFHWYYGSKYLSKQLNNVKIIKLIKIGCKKGYIMNSTSKEMAKIACMALEDKKGQDIKIINIEEISVIADYFILASGSNKNQVQALVDNVQESLGKAGFHAKQVEGYQTGNWILLDYHDIIIHIFNEEDRLFYDLERIWKDGKDISVEELIK